MKKFNQNDSTKARIGDDLIRGAAAIAEELREPLRRTYYMLEAGDLPAFRLAGRWYVRRSALIAYFQRLETEARNG